MHALHIANSGPARQTTVSGLPGNIKSMHIVRSGSGEAFHHAGKVKVVKGNATLDLPPWSLVTLTTLRLEERNR